MLHSSRSRTGSNIDLEKESHDYFNSLALSGGHEGFQSALKETIYQQDSIDNSQDLIVTVSGEELACSIVGIDATAVQYAFFMNKKVMENSIDKSEVYYIVTDFQGVNPEQIILTPNSSKDFHDLIVTATGSTIICFIDHVGTNTVEYYINEDGNTIYQILKKDEVLYFGSNFLDAIEGQEEVSQSKYDDFIVTRNNSVLLCNIETDT